MNDILSAINEASKESDAFENHPAKKLSLEERVLYLQGLALVMKADGDTNNDEREYLRILIKSFDMDESILDSLEAFANAPDKDSIQEFFRCFRRKPIAQLFLFDAMMMAYRDGSVCDTEKAVIDKLASQLEVLQATLKDIYDLMGYIKNKNWQESAVYFSTHLLNPDYFKHILDYYEIDLNELLEDSQSIKQQRLLEIIASNINTQQFDWIPLEYNISGSNPDLSLLERKEKYLSKFSKITRDYIDLKKLLSSADLILPWLQAMLDRREIRVANNTLFLTSKSTAFTDESQAEIGTLDDMGIRYHPETLSFSQPQNSDIPTFPKSLLILFLQPLVPNIDKTDKQENILRINDFLQKLFNAQLLYGRGTFYPKWDDNTVHDTEYLVNEDNESTFISYSIHPSVLATPSFIGILGAGSSADKVDRTPNTKQSWLEFLLSGQYRLMR